MEKDAARNPAVDTVIDYSARVNFSFQQNAIPILRRIEIRNLAKADLRNVTCRFTPSPEWGSDFEQHISLIPAESDYILADVPVELSFAFLASLSDRVRGELRVEISADGEEEGTRQTVFSKTLPVEVYAYDEWTGLQSLPEILAAFVTPNVSVVETLLSRVSDHLGEVTGSGALDGYQTKSKRRVYDMLDCAFRAIREAGIRYSNPPASFENSGQRVRFCEKIAETKLATCLDLCLLFAAVLEQAGLRPLILLHKGHAYAGCWLIEESFPEPTRDSLQDIRKRVELDEILLFEPTLVCEGNRADFEASVAAARRHLSLDDIFEYAIDIGRARAAGIRPLPLERGEARIDLAAAAAKREPVAERLPDRTEQRVFAEDADIPDEPLTPEGRVEHWKQQLLDLTLRNRLLNFRETKRTVPLICPDPEHLEDELSLQTAFALKPQSKLMAGADPRSLALQERQFADDPLMTHLVEELRAKRLRSSLTEAEHARRLLELYRRARMEMEESGANTLYLALGFLEWKETSDSDRTHLAPILLIPVTLERKSVQQGFSLRRYDDDPIINVTLLELLKRDFELEIPGVNPPPEDEKGVDVARVFRRFQEAVKNLRGWEVHREVWLAQFSFNKFLLWKDLNDRVDALTKHPVVDHLVNRAGQPFPEAIEGIREEELDEKVGCGEVFCPVSADSSQLAAIIAAARGKNFVLHGPPGTGKSQTITNLIAHCLALGKRVLFVAEKRAALDVVHHRLSQIGLAPFCLELHSNKAGKADVLRQFGEALDFGARHTPEEWGHLAEKLEATRSELNAYAKALHRRYPNGLSAYHCYSWLIARPAETAASSPEIELRLDGIEEHSRAYFEGLQKLCDDLRIRGSESRLSRAAKDALKPVGATAWTPAWEDDVLAGAKTLRSKAEAFCKLLRKVGEFFGDDFEKLTKNRLEALVDLCARLVDAPELPKEFVEDGEWEEFRKRAEEWVAAGRRRDAARKALAGFHLESVLTLDLDGLKERHAALTKKEGLLTRIRTWFLLKPVRKAREKGASKWKIAGADEFFRDAEELVVNHRTVAEANESAARRLGDAFWADGEADWDEVEKRLDFGNHLDRLIAEIAGNDDERQRGLRSRAGQLLAESRETADAGAARQLFAQLAVDWEEMGHAEDVWKKRIDFQDSVPLMHAGHVESLLEIVDRLKRHKSDLQNWCRWQQSCREAKAAGLEPLLALVESEALPLSGLRDAFEKAYRENFIWRLRNLSEVLRNFWGDEHQSRIERFRELDEQFTRATAAMVVARLASELPSARGDDCPPRTELGTLQRERVKRARHKPVRKLLSEIPNIAPKLKPCFLMSPLSVAQYLDAGQDNFDIVVFDEASQIPVWDAIGAIARGKQMIVVGDPKQLPPTNFFDRGDGDGSAIDDGTIVDLESILDECRGSGVPGYYLRWHYRSRREGLIAFSNRHYYENKLYTFPAPHSEAGVRLVPVPDGFYDKGKSRTNRAEAEAVVAEVLRRLKDPEKARESIGIVTFSQAQQTLIMDRLDEARREHPEIEGHFGEDAEEPVFVKNLENVQGDERDVILFSICYGPDEAGRVSMNFGPLNRDGGERRLNVAITRAKREVVVFSTLRSEQIDLSRTRARGAEQLKAYLEYAERGPRALAAAIDSAEQDEFDSMFESEVAEFLRKEGFTVHTRIGCSGYRIDLGIVSPDKPGRYILGIECDGARYHRTATARDRDRLRQSVLEGLGWRIHRIWSTDWWRNREQAEKSLIETVNRALEESKLTDESGNGNSGAATSGPVYPSHEDSSASEVRESPPIASRDEGSGPAPYAGNAAIAESPARVMDYPKVDLRPQTPQEQFYEPEAGFAIKRQLERIITAEGPIIEGLLLKRAADEWDFSRIGPRIREIFAKHLPEALAKTRQQGQAVYWPRELSPDDYQICRVPTEQEESRRKIDEIPLEEIQNAALGILERYISYPKEDLLREVAKKFGIGRLTGNTADHLEQALQRLFDRGAIAEENGTVSLV